MLYFNCDYNNGAHPDVLRALVDTNPLHAATYGDDEWSQSARRKIATACGHQEANVFFLAGGTQTNQTVIDALLARPEAVIATEVGHVNVHEAMAIEYTGHKVITLPQHDGLMSAADLDDYMARFEADPTRLHMAQPAMVYVSLPSELGTLYTAEQLAQLHATCQCHQLLFFVDGARLGYGLAASAGDITLEFLADHCDVFYIGGTKQGALCGEAVVFPRGNAPRLFFTMIKQHGALAAKGRLAGVQFDALFTDGLYLRISQHAVAMASRLRQLFEAQGLRAASSSPTNQQFFQLPNTLIERLQGQVEFEVWEPVDADSSLCRFVTSWATTAEEVEALGRLVSC